MGATGQLSMNNSMNIQNPLPRGIPSFDQEQRKIYKISIGSLYEFVSLLFFHRKPIKHTTSDTKITYTFIHIFIYTYLLILFTCRFLKINIPISCNFSSYISKKLRCKATFLRPSYSHKSQFPLVRFVKLF